MPRPKITMPENPFDGEQPGAIDKLTGGAALRRPAPEVPVSTPHPPPTQFQVEGTSSKKKQHRDLKQTSFYLSPEDLSKLQDLAYTHSKRMGRLVNRNDIIRHLLRKAGVNDFMDLELE